MSDKPSPTVQHYEIRLRGYLDARWGDRFEGMTITLEEDGNTLLYGPVTDQSALHGLLKKVRDLGMPLVSVVQIQVLDSHQNDSKKRKDEHEQQTYSSDE